MKKKFLATISIAVASISLLTGCGTNNLTTAIKPYWLINSNFPDTEFKETLVYDVSFKAGLGQTSINYSLDYDGTYTTTLETVEKNQASGGIVYKYTTNLDIDVTYRYAGKTETFKDSVISQMVMEFKNSVLRPISMHKEIVSNSPINGANNPSVPYDIYECAIDTVYNADGKSGNSTLKNQLKENSTPKKSTFKAEDRYTYLDNEQLLLAVRGISQTIQSATFFVYSPFTTTIQTVDFKLEEKVSDKDFKFTNNSVETTKIIPYIPIKFSISSGNTGETQTVWVASMESTDNNINRNLILHMEVPIAYKLGTLNYNLKEITYNEYNN